MKIPIVTSAGRKLVTPGEFSPSCVHVFQSPDRRYVRRYVPVDASDVPTRLAWVTSRADQGQLVEISYSAGTPTDSRTNQDADFGDPWRRTIDRACGDVGYERLAVDRGAS